MTATDGTTKARKVTGPVIGPVQLESPVVLAPMAGVCNLAFRLLCKEQGAALVCSEFVSAKALVHGNQKSFEMLAVSEKERPVSIQIFGSTPEDAALPPGRWRRRGPTSSTSTWAARSPR